MTFRSYDGQYLPGLDMNYVVSALASKIDVL